jgi:glutathione S-transferase
MNNRSASRATWKAWKSPLKWHLALLERQFIDGGTFLTGSAFDIAYATFYALVRYTRRGKGKTAALLQDLFAVEAWANRIRAVGHGERRDIIRAEAIEIARLGTHRRAEAE